MLLDLGSGIGLSIKNYLHANQARQHDIQVHAFEPDPWKVVQLRKFLTDSKLHKQPMVHDTAVWIANDQVMFLLSLKKHSVPSLSSRHLTFLRRLYKFLLVVQHQCRIVADMLKWEMPSCIVLPFSTW